MGVALRSLSLRKVGNSILRGLAVSHRRYTQITPTPEHSVAGGEDNVGKVYAEMEIQEAVHRDSCETGLSDSTVRSQHRAERNSEAGRPVKERTAAKPGNSELPGLMGWGVHPKELRDPRPAERPAVHGQSKAVTKL